MTVESASEGVVGRLVPALVVGAAGPVAGWLAAWVALGPVLGRTVEDGGDVIEVTFDVLESLVVVALVALPAAWVATAAAFVLTRAHRPFLGIAAVTFLMPFWWGAVDRLLPADGWGYLALLGCLPFAVRIAMSTRPRATGVRPIVLDLSARGDPPG